MARSVKTRGLAVPETMPACLYPPGYERVVAPTVAPLEAKAKSSKRVGANEPVDDAVEQSPRKHAKPSGADEKATHPPQRGVTVKTTELSNKFMEGKTDQMKSRTETENKAEENEEERNNAYEMSDKEKIRYDKIFDKLTNGKATNLGGKEVGTHEH